MTRSATTRLVCASIVSIAALMGSQGSAGRGSALTFINLETDVSLALQASGSVSRVTLHPDGTSTWVTTGHNVLILFPNDVPAGPSTTLHVGRVVFTVDTDGVFTVTEVSGTTTDICAALSG